MKALLKRLFTGHSTRSQDNDNHFELETIERLPEQKREKYKRTWISYLRKKSISENDLNSRKIWPKALSDGIGSSTNLYAIEEYMKSEHEFINSSIFEKIFTKYSPYYRDLSLLDFGKVTRQSVDNEISWGNRIIISRVIESNVNGAFGSIPQKLKDALDDDKKPLVQLFLAPIDSLRESAKKEADDLQFLLSKGCPQDFLLKENRGISPLYFITQLRYLWLYLGTVTFAYAFSRWQPNYFYFHFNNKTPSARCTIIEKKRSSKRISPETNPSEFGDVFFIQLHENGVGFDGSCYKYFGESQFDHDLYKEFTTGSILKSTDEINEIYNECSKIENRIIHDSVLEIEKNKLLYNSKLVKVFKDNEPIIINQLKQSVFDTDNSYEKEFNVLSFTNIWREYNCKHIIPNDNLKLEDMNRIIGQITDLQIYIDTYLSKIRKPIESGLYGQPICNIIPMGNR